MRIFDENPQRTIDRCAAVCYTMSTDVTTLHKCEDALWLTADLLVSSSQRSWLPGSCRECIRSGSPSAFPIDGPELAGMPASVFCERRRCLHALLIVDAAGAQGRHCRDRDRVFASKHRRCGAGLLGAAGAVGSGLSIAAGMGLPW